MRALAAVCALAALIAGPQPRVAVNGIPQLPNRPTLNLVGQVNCSDNAAGGSKDCSISSGVPAVLQPMTLQLARVPIDVAAPWVTDSSVIVCGVEGPFPASLTVLSKTAGVGFSVLVELSNVPTAAITLDCLGGSP